MSQLNHPGKGSVSRWMWAIVIVTVIAVGVVCVLTPEGGIRRFLGMGDEQKTAYSDESWKVCRYPKKSLSHRWRMNGTT